MPSRAATLSLVLAAAAAPVAAATTSLVVGEGWAVVCQRLAVTFTNATQEVPFDRLPPETDPLSLVVLPVSGPVAMPSWRRPDGGTITATLATDLPRERVFDLAGLVRGPTWRASYQLIVRADPGHEDAPVSMDVDGRITVRNASGGSWSNAALRVVGTDHRPAPAADEHGFLELDEASPLSGPWLRPRRGENPAFGYDLGRNVRLQAGEERSFTFVSVERRNAARRYLLTSDDIALDGSEPGRPLRRFIALPNDAAHGLGRDLPGGVAQIYIGSVRATLGEGAWLERTPAGGEIRIELGASDRVLGLRRQAGREPGTPGQVEENFEIEIRNALESPALVEVVEQPPVRRDWAVVRSSHAYEIHSRRLHYRLEIPARDRGTIRYTIRMPEQKI